MLKPFHFFLYVLFFFALLLGSCLDREAKDYERKKQAKQEMDSLFYDADKVPPPPEGKSY